MLTLENTYSEEIGKVYLGKFLQLQNALNRS